MSTAPLLSCRATWFRARCHLQAVLEIAANFSEDAASSNGSSSQNQSYTLITTNTAVLCPQPTSADCIRTTGYSECLAAAFAEVNPDNHRPCPATDGYSLQACLSNPDYAQVVVIQAAVMNLSTSPAQQQPIYISRNVTIMSDPR